MKETFFIILQQIFKAIISDFELISMRHILCSTILFWTKFNLNITDYSEMQIVLFCFTTII